MIEKDYELIENILIKLALISCNELSDKDLFNLKSYTCKIFQTIQNQNIIYPTIICDLVTFAFKSFSNDNVNKIIDAIASADPTLVNAKKEGESPLTIFFKEMRSCERDHFSELLKILLKHKADPNYHKAGSPTCLQMIGDSRLTPWIVKNIVLPLLENGADPKKGDKKFKFLIQGIMEAPSAENVELLSRFALPWKDFFDGNMSHIQPSMCNKKKLHTLFNNPSCV